MSFTKSRYLAVASGHTDALIEYVLDVKPYHTKLSEVVERYELNDELQVSISDNVTVLAFLGADIMESIAPSPNIRARRSNSWWREVISDGSRRTWQVPLTSVHKFLSHAGQEVFIAGTNDNLQIPGIANLGAKAFSPRRWDGPSVTNVRKQGIHQQESFDYFLSHGAYTFETRAGSSPIDRRWIDHNIAGVSAFAESAGNLFYQDVVKPFGRIIDINPNDPLNQVLTYAADEWTLTCTSLSPITLEIVGKYNGFIGEAFVDVPFVSLGVELLRFTFTALEGEAAPAIEIGDQFVLTPYHKITVDVDAENETWSLIKTNPIVITAKPTFSTGVGTPTRLYQPALEIHTRSLDRTVNPSTWTVTFNGDGTYDLEKVGVDPLSISSIDLRDGCSFKNEDIHFTIIPTIEGFFAGDTFTFSIGADVANYLVYGSVSGFQPNATIGEWYWNGRIGFKIPKLEYFASSNVVDFNAEANLTPAKSVHSIAEPSVYTITFQPPILPNTTVLHATVVNNIYGYRKSLTVDEVWEDEFCSFTINQLATGTFQAGDQVFVHLAPKYIYTTEGGYDEFQYELPLYDVDVFENEVALLYNEEYFPLYHAHGLVIFKSGCVNGDVVVIDKALLDVMRFRINEAATFSPELAPVNGWIPLEFRYFDRPLSPAALYDGKTAHFPDLTTQIEAYLCSDPTVKVFTISQPRYQCSNRNGSATLVFDEDFFSSYLSFGTRFSLRAQPDSSYGQKVRVKVTENLRAFARVTLGLGDLVEINLYNGQYDELPYDVDFYDIPLITVNEIVEPEPFAFRMAVEEPTPPEIVERNTIESAGTSFAESFSIAEIVGASIDRLSVSFDFSTDAVDGLLIEDAAATYLITHNGPANSPTLYIEDASNPATSASPLPNMMPFTQFPTAVCTTSFSFSLPEGFPVPFRLRIT